MMRRMQLVKLRRWRACQHACLHQPQLLFTALSCASMGVLNLQIFRVLLIEKARVAEHTGGQMQSGDLIIKVRKTELSLEYTVVSSF